MCRLISALLLAIIAINCNAIYLINSNNSSVGKFSKNPAVWAEDGLWGSMLEDWAIGKSSVKIREARVMKVIPLSNAYVIEDKLDEDDKKESKINTGKIVVSNTSSNKKPAGRPITESDLYLLNAIEKLVYRVDFMEKRLRRVEEMLYFVMAGNRVDQEPCQANFTRVGQNCYQFSSSAGREYDWKVASKYCKKTGGVLAEFETIEEYQDIITYIQSNANFRGKNFWTGGLNPGLLWIWSNSARPVVAPGSEANKQNPSAAILGDGRCLRLGYDPALRSYSYRGTDCSVRYSYICELPENSSSNEIQRIGRAKDIFKIEL